MGEVGNHTHTRRLVPFCPPIAVTCGYLISPSTAALSMPLTAWPGGKAVLFTLGQSSILGG